MNTHVLTNAKYSKNIDENTKTNLKKLENNVTKLKTVSGDISVESAKGEIEAKSVSGNIEIEKTLKNIQTM